MAKSKVDACIFCEQVPCICNQKAKPSKPAKRQAKPKTESASEPIARSSHLEAMRAAAVSAPVRPPAPVVIEKHSPPRTELSEDDIVWNAAIRNLAPLMSESDKELYAGIITSKPHPDEAKIMWKRRRTLDAES